jgi:hypothetical protein
VKYFAAGILIALAGILVTAITTSIERLLSIG